MKYIAKILGAATIAALTIATPAIAQVFEGNAPWTAEHKVVAAGAGVLLAADWLQTRQIAKHPDKFHEYNPVLGEHPSQGKVNLYFLAAAGGLMLLADFLPAEYRTGLLYGVIVVQAAAVTNNLSEGISIRW